MPWIPAEPTLRETALSRLQKDRVISIRGRSGVGKSHFANDVAQSLSERQGGRILAAVGDGYRQHASFHPFEQPLPRELLRTSEDSLTSIVSSLAIMLTPMGQLARPILQLLRSLYRTSRATKTGFTQEEIEGGRAFAAAPNAERVFIFDNLHLWDEKSLRFAQKVVQGRRHLRLSVILVSTDYDTISSVNDFKSVLDSVPNQSRIVFPGLRETALKTLFLQDVDDDACEVILAHAGANIPMIKELAKLTYYVRNQEAMRELVRDAALDFRISNLPTLSGNERRQRALGCLAVLGPNSSLREIACAMEMSIDEAHDVLSWGVQHELIQIVGNQQLFFLHDTFRRLFDETEIVDMRLLDKINFCCVLAIPDEYEKRISIAARGNDTDRILALILSFIRTKILSWNESESNLSAELARVFALAGVGLAKENDAVRDRLARVLAHAAVGEFSEAAWAVRLSDICTLPAVFVEETIMFAHYAFLSRENAMRAEAIRKLADAKALSGHEAEQSFTVSSMLAYGLALENRLKDATIVLAEEAAQLATSSQRFRGAPFYIAVLERMSLICYENTLAQHRLQRAYTYFEETFHNDGYLKRPDELIKCASNLCSALIIGNRQKQALEVANAAKAAMMTIDLSWSTAPSYLENNQMVAAVHSGASDFRHFAERWVELAHKDFHNRLPFLVNALGCFNETQHRSLGTISASDVISQLRIGLGADRNHEAFMAYVAYFAIWQSTRCLGIAPDTEDTLEVANTLVDSIPYVNGHHFRTRHKALLDTVGAKSRVRVSEWQARAFSLLPHGALPIFYRRAVHFNPVEHWLPQ